MHSVMKADKFETCAHGIHEKKTPNQVVGLHSERKYKWKDQKCDLVDENEQED